MEFTVGALLEGKVKSITKFGAFITLPENRTGMVHISEVANTYVSDIHDHLTEGQDVKVKVIGIKDGKISLSMKALIQQETEEEEHETFDYKETAAATTGLGDLLKGLKL